MMDSRVKKHIYGPSLDIIFHLADSSWISLFLSIDISCSIKTYAEKLFFFLDNAFATMTILMGLV